MRDRTLGREAALIRLYEIDLSPDEANDAAPLLVPGTELPAAAERFALELVLGVRQHLEVIDLRIREASENWELRRMPVIDRNILRLAVFELLYRDDIPPKVSINEAIELGKRYSTERSGAFINGILDHIKNNYLQVGSTTDAGEPA
jgi:transcription antitermination factor NusB